MNSGMLPAKALILAYARIRITAAGPLLNLTGFPFMHYSTCDTDSLQETAHKINLLNKKVRRVRPDKASIINDRLSGFSIDSALI